MRRSLGIVIMLVFLLQILGASTNDADSSTWEYTPYLIDEFPPWAAKLRRAETVLFGSLPLTVAVTGVGYSVLQSFGVGSIGSSDVQEALALGAVALSLSVFISLLDFILGEYSQ